MSGAGGQKTMTLLSHDLVVVRLGTSNVLEIARWDPKGAR